MPRNQCRLHLTSGIEVVKICSSALAWTCNSQGANSKGDGPDLASTSEELVLKCKQIIEMIQGAHVKPTEFPQIETALNKVLALSGPSCESPAASACVHINASHFKAVHHIAPLKVKKGIRAWIFEKTIPNCQIFLAFCAHPDVYAIDCFIRDCCLQGKDPRAVGGEVNERASCLLNLGYPTVNVSLGPNLSWICNSQGANSKGDGPKGKQTVRKGKSKSKKGKAAKAAKPNKNESRKVVSFGVVKENRSDVMQEVLYRGVDGTRIADGFDIPKWEGVSEFISFPVSVNTLSAMSIMAGRTDGIISTVPASFTHVHWHNLSITVKPTAQSSLNGLCIMGWIPADSGELPHLDTIHEWLAIRRSAASSSSTKTRDYVLWKAEDMRQLTFQGLLPGGSKKVNEIVGYIFYGMLERVMAPQEQLVGASVPSSVQNPTPLVPFQGVLAELYVKVGMTAQYRTYIAPRGNNALFTPQETVMTFPLQQVTAYDTGGTDAYMWPMQAIGNRQFMDSVVNTENTNAQNTLNITTTTAGWLTYQTRDYNGQTVTSAIPEIFIWIADSVLSAIGLPPKTATIAMAGVDCLVSLATTVMSEFEQKTLAMHDANSQNSDGTCGTILTSQGCATSNAYQRNATRTNIALTPAAQFLLNALLASDNTANFTLGTFIKQLTTVSANFYPLLFTWPVDETPAMPTLESVYFETDADPPILREYPNPSILQAPLPNSEMDYFPSRLVHRRPFAPLHCPLITTSNARTNFQAAFVIQPNTDLGVSRRAAVGHYRCEGTNMVFVCAVAYDGTASTQAIRDDISSVLGGDGWSFTSADSWWTTVKIPFRLVGTVPAGDLAAGSHTVSNDTAFTDYIPPQGFTTFRLELTDSDLYFHPVAEHLVRRSSNDGVGEHVLPYFEFTDTQAGTSEGHVFACGTDF
jgi:hypothetical protein